MINNEEQEINIRLKMAKNLLLNQSPFFQTLLSSTIMIPSRSIETMGIGIVGEGPLFKLIYNPEFVMSLTNEAIVSVLEHEILHIILGHIYIDKTQFTNLNALDVACEVSANEYVRNVKNLPTPILLKDFDLPRGESTLTRYTKLMFDERLKLKRNTMDDHEEWSNSNLSNNSKKSIIKSSIILDFEEASKKAKTVIEKQLIKAIQKEFQIPSNQNQSGKKPGHKTDTLIGIGKPKALHWERILSYSNIIQEPSLSLSKPSRRAPELIGIIPGRRFIHKKPNILVAIDTSGSMSGDDLYDIAGQIDSLYQFANIIVVQCDTEITKIDENYKAGSLLNKEKSIKGRGGTSFIPVFNFLKTKSHIDFIIYFTDGFSEEVPEEPPKRTNVIWAMVSGNPPPVTWGKIVYI